MNLRCAICGLRLSSGGLKSGLGPAHSKLSRVGQALSNLARRLQRGALTAALLFGGPQLLHCQPASPASSDIPPLAPPLPEIPPSPWEHYGWLLWIFIPLALLLVAAVAWLALRPGKPPVLPAPAARARTALQALLPQPEDGTTLGWISQALRQYLIAAFWLPPHEMTTRDFCTCLAAQERIDPALAAALCEFLRSCDERKFAPAAGRPPLLAASRAMELVEQTEASRIAGALPPMMTPTPPAA